MVEKFVYGFYDVWMMDKTFDFNLKLNETDFVVGRLVLMFGH